MSIIHELLVENKIHNNVKTVKKMYNSLLRESKQDLALYKNEFSTLNEQVNVDDSDLKSGFKRVSETLKSAKQLIESADSAQKLEEKQKNIKQANVLVQEGNEFREELMESFSNTVNKAQKIFESVN